MHYWYCSLILELCALDIPVGVLVVSSSPVLLAPANWLGHSFWINPLGWVCYSWMEGHLWSCIVVIPLSVLPMALSNCSVERGIVGYY